MAIGPTRENIWNAWASTRLIDEMKGPRSHMSNAAPRKTSANGRRLAAFAVLCLSASAALAANDLAECERDDLPVHEADACDAAISFQAKSPIERGRLYTLRGYAWMREGEAGGAVAEFTRAIDLDATNIAALRGRARAYTRLKNYDMAAQDWTRVIASRPADEQNYRERALSYLEDGKTKEAFADYDKAIALKAQNPQSFIGRAGIYVRMQMREAALREFDKAAAADPAYPDTYFAKAQAAEGWGDTEMAIANYALVVRYRGDVWYAQRAMKRLGKQFSDFERWPDTGKAGNTP